MRRVLINIATGSIAVAAIAAAPLAAFAEPQQVEVPRVIVNVPRIVVDVPRVVVDVPRIVVDVPRIVVDVPHIDVQRIVNAVVSPQVAREVARDVQQRRTNQFPFEQVDRDTRTIPLGPNGSLDLRNLSGRITVTGGSGRDVTIAIAKTARGRTEADAARGLKEVTSEISHQGSRASIETRYPDQDRNRPDYSVSVAYDITAPAGTNVSIHNLSGGVTIKNVSGEISVDVASGDIGISHAAKLALIKALSGDLTLTDIKGTGTLDAGTMSGDVRVERVQMPRLIISTISGDIIASDVTADAATLKATSGSIGYTGALARTGKYELHSHSGDVTLTVIGNAGFDLTARTFSGRVSPDSALGLKARTSDRREVRGVVGDGGATVQATTFSGNVIIVRK